MSDLTDAVYIFLSLPLTHQHGVMRDFEFSTDWNLDPYKQRYLFMGYLQTNDKVEEFVNTMKKSRT